MTLWTVVCKALLQDSPGRILEWVGCHALFQGIFPTQGSNPGLPHCRWIIYLMSHQGSPKEATEIHNVHSSWSQDKFFRFGFQINRLWFLSFNIHIIYFCVWKYVLYLHVFDSPNQFQLLKKVSYDERNVYGVRELDFINFLISMNPQIFIFQISLCIFTNYLLKSEVEVKCFISILDKSGNIMLTLYEHWQSFIVISTIENLIF